MELAITIVIGLVVGIALLLFFRGRAGKSLPRESDEPQSGAATSSAGVNVDEAAPEVPAAPTPHVAVAREPVNVAPAPTPAPETIIEEAPESLRSSLRAAGPLVPKTAAEGGRDQEVAAFKQGLTVTRGGFVARLSQLFFGAPKLDQALLDRAEELLLAADVGVKTTTTILGALKDAGTAGKLNTAENVSNVLTEIATGLLAVESRPFGSQPVSPLVILVIGVNGVGKTTTIGKLASRFQRQGKRVLLAAGDTFRAAAVLQLEVWGRRVECPVVKGKDGADPGSVIFDAIKRAQAEGIDVVIADTAGRLHTKVPLMDELKKLARTVAKALDRPADEVLLVLDATTGQNAVQQAHMFRETMEITGIALTKLDGTAKGGVVLGIAHEHRIPVRFVGLGERVEDLREFDAAVFAEALFSKSEESVAG